MPADTLRLIAEVQPNSLMLADPRLSPEVLAEIFSALSAPLPTQLYFYGRLLEVWHSRMEEVSAGLQTLGYQPTDSFDPNICRGFSLADAAD